MNCFPLLNLVMSKVSAETFVIKGCEAYGEGERESPYLTRWRILPLKCPVGLYLHWFHRSDGGREMHDHPWSYVSIILWRGYYEVTPNGRRRFYPGMILRRPATHVHRVELVDDNPAITLVMRGRYVREWGFHMPREGWIHFKEYFKRFGC